MEEGKGSRNEAAGTPALQDERVAPRRLERSSAREEESQESVVAWKRAMTEFQGAGSGKLCSDMTGS